MPLHITEFQTDSQASTKTKVISIHKQKYSHLILTDQPHLKNSITHPVTNIEQAKQIIKYIVTLSHSTTLCSKVLQELNFNGFCKHNNTHQAYLHAN